MPFLSHNSSDTPGLAPHECPTSFPGRDMWKTIWNHLLGSSMVGTGILAQYEVPSFQCFTLLFGFFCRCRGCCHGTESDFFLFLMTVLIMIIYSDPSIDRRYTNTQLDLITKFDFLPNCVWFPKNIYPQRVRHAIRGRLLLRTPIHVPLWELHDFCVLMFRPISPELVLLWNFWVSIIPRYLRNGRRV